MILFWGFFVAILATGLSFLLPMRFSAASQMMLILRSQSGVDPYTQSKAAERIGENLAQVLATRDFYEKVMAAPNENFNKDRWNNLDERNQRKQWQKDVSAEVVYGTSLLNITVYSYTKDDAVTLARAVTDVVMQSGWEYIGGDISIKTVNAPFPARFIARPNFALNAILGFLVGTILSAIWTAKRSNAWGF